MIYLHCITSSSMKNYKKEEKILNEIKAGLQSLEGSILLVNPPQFEIDPLKENIPPVAAHLDEAVGHLQVDCVHLRPVAGLLGRVHPEYQAVHPLQRLLEVVLEFLLLPLLLDYPQPVLLRGLVKQ